MSDCALAITNAVIPAYTDLKEKAPKHYWCLFHVLNEFKENAKTHLPDRHANALADFHQMIYSGEDPKTLLALLYVFKVGAHKHHFCCL
jgi:hypothetical protein